MNAWDNIVAICRKYGWAIKVWAEPNVVKCQITWLEDDDEVELITAPNGPELFSRIDAFCKSRLEVSPG